MQIVLKQHAVCDYIVGLKDSRCIVEDVEMKRSLALLLLLAQGRLCGVVRQPELYTADWEPEIRHFLGIEEEQI